MKLDFVGVPEGFREEWVAALRSGEYKQVTYVIRDNDKFCCLGVGCDIAPGIDWLHGTSWRAVLSSDASASYAGYVVPYLPLAQSHELSKLNDEQCYTLAQIADIIEQAEVTYQ